MSILSQVYIFVYSLVFGLILGVIFDVFRIADIVLNISLKRIFFEDIIYFMIIGVLSFLFMIVINKGEFRIFIILGELIGFSVYHFTVGRIVIKFFEKVIYFLKKKMVTLRMKLEKPLRGIFLKMKKFDYSVIFKNKFFKKKKAS